MKPQHLAFMGAVATLLGIGYFSGVEGLAKLLVTGGPIALLMAFYWWLET